MTLNDYNHDAFRGKKGGQYIRTKRITKEQTDRVISLFGTYSCVKIASLVGVTLNQVYEVRKRHNLTDKQNPVFNLNDLQIQLLLGGRLGDGNFKPNGLHNYYYRESHAEDELGYLMWKQSVFGQEITTTQGIYKIKKAGYNVQQPYGFSTKTSPTFIEYANMTHAETISKLDYMGFIIFMLDDGWFSKHSRVGNFCISGGEISLDNLKLLCEKGNNLGLKNIHIVGHKRYDISIPSENNNHLYDMATSFIPKDTDIIIKKFKI